MAGEGVHVESTAQGASIQSLQSRLQVTDHLPHITYGVHTIVSVPSFLCVCVYRFNLESHPLRVVRGVWCVVCGVHHANVGGQTATTETQYIAVRTSSIYYNVTMGFLFFPRTIHSSCSHSTKSSNIETGRFLHFETWLWLCLCTIWGKWTLVTC